MSRAASLPTSVAGAAAVVTVAVCAVAAPAAPVGALLTAAVAVWAAAFLATRTVTMPSGTPDAGRLSLLTMALALLLVAKDLLPAPGAAGEPERRVALAPAEPAWPATARNPALGAAAAQWGALLAGGAVAAAIARATAGTERAGAFTLSALAWLVAAFGAVVARNARAGLASADTPGWMAASKNGAGALVALGVVLHLGLALRAWGRSRVPLTALHGAAAATLLSPLASLSSWTGLLALAAGGAALVAGRAAAGPRRAVPWMLAGAAGAGLALAVAATRPELVRRMADFSGDYRLAIWRDAASLVRESPLLGAGAGAFEQVYPLHGRLEIVFDARLSHPDSSWVLLAAEWGLAPLGLLLLLGGGLLRPRPGYPDTSDAAAVARAGAAAWLAAGVTDVALHRPENFAAGMVLLGVAAGGRGTAPGARGMAAAGAALAAGIALALWAAGPGARELRWGLLDPARLWNAALAGGERGATEPANLDRLRAAVKLQHRAVTYPFAVAKIVHPVSPAAAREFWSTAVRRAGDLGFDYLARAGEAFPATPPEYWLQLARETDPDNALFVAGLPAAEAARQLEAWAARPAVEPGRPAVARQFLRSAGRLGRADLVERAIPRLASAEPALREEAARLLLEAAKPEAAWRLLEGLLPPAEPAAPGQPGPAGVPQALLAAGRYAELRAWVLAAPPPEANAVLARICAQPAAPVWFLFRHARARAAEGDARGAADAALRGLAARAARR